jgi:uncharacterized protein (TIGR02145 family)
MKKEKRIWSFLFVVIGITVLFTFSCKKDDNTPDNPTNGKTTAIFNPVLDYGSVTDQEGNTYKTIVIGTQTWMAENLRTAKYRNGDSITEITDSIEWSNLKTGAYCNYENRNSDEMIATYGRLYNWHAVSDSRNLAPLGWHIPSNDEWTTLISYLDGETLAIKKLKEQGKTHWSDFNEGSDNSSGFTALPGGWRWGLYFMSMGDAGYWWSSTEDDNKINAWYRNLTIQPDETVTPYIFFKECGFSVRCVKD